MNSYKLTKEKTTTLFSGLGKATMRGVRRCPKCGTFNGTRGSNCKNKMCDNTFQTKTTAPRKKTETEKGGEAVRLSTGPGPAEFYSVYLGPVPGNRCFVSLPTATTSVNLQSAAISTAMTPDLLGSSTSCPTSVDGENITVQTSDEGGIGDDPSLPHNTDAEFSMMLFKGAQCFAESCSARYDMNIDGSDAGHIVDIGENIGCDAGSIGAGSIGSGNIGAAEPCVHIKAAINCRMEATPVEIKIIGINSVNLTESRRVAIYKIALESPVPIVQRVSKHSFVVRNRVLDSVEEMVGDSRDTQLTANCQPLDMLHISFVERGKTFSRGACCCQEFKLSDKSDSAKRCVHYFLCLCAFAGDAALRREFLSLINKTETPAPPEHSVTPILISAAPDHHTTVHHLEGHHMQHSQEVVIKDTAGDVLAIGDINSLDHQCLITAAVTAAGGFSTPSVAAAGARKEDSVVQASSALLTLQDGRMCTELVGVSGSLTPIHSGRTSVGANLEVHAMDPMTAGSFITQKISPRKASMALPVLPAPVVDESMAQVTFLQWLASVTERINQGMHYQTGGKQPPLVFHAPQIFFEHLQHRLSLGSRKKRLPDFEASFTRYDAMPIGTFMKYTWHLSSVSQVKMVFDLPEMPVETTRSFVQDKSGGYTLYEPPSLNSHHQSKGAVVYTTNTGLLDQSDEQFSGICGKGGRAAHQRELRIKPRDRSVFMKVGRFPTDKDEFFPFVIEWIPDILPKTKIGELRVSFEFGHRRNGVVVENPMSPRTIVMDDMVTVETPYVFQ